MLQCYGQRQIPREQTQIARNSRHFGGFCVCSRDQPRPQLALEHLAVTVLRQLVDELVSLGSFEAGNALEQVGIQFGGGRRADDERDHDLTPFRVRRTDDSGLRDARVL
jgi:hypothetical protein